MRLTSWTTHTPAGPLTLVLDDAAVVRAAGFTDDVHALAARIGVRAGARAVSAVTDVGEIGKRVAAFLDGDLAALDAVPVDQGGTPFQHDVWDALRRIPPGQTRSYAALAAMADRPQAVRAAGSACGRNLLAPFVPCHRAVRGDGGLGGYAYGLAAKRWLLGHERVHLPHAAR